MFIIHTIFYRHAIMSLTPLDQLCGVAYCFSSHPHRSVWMETTSVACSTPQVAEEEEAVVLPRPRVVSVAAVRDSPAITIRDPRGTEG